jgi:hypothetical protein
MEKIYLQKTAVMTDVTSYLKAEDSARNKKGRTYSYVAKLSDYQSTRKIKRDFADRVTDLTVKNDDWILLISTSFLNKLASGEIIEIGVNLKQSNTYSLVSKSYFLVLENSDAELVLEYAPTAFQIFKRRDTL